MKKLLITLLAVCFIFSLVGCSGTQQESDKSKIEEIESQTQAEIDALKNQVEELESKLEEVPSKLPTLEEIEKDFDFEGDKYVTKGSDLAPELKELSVLLESLNNPYGEQVNLSYGENEYRPEWTHAVYKFDSEIGTPEVDKIYIGKHWENDTEMRFVFKKVLGGHEVYANLNDLKAAGVIE